MIMQAIDLADEICLTEQSDGITVTSDSSLLVCDKTNLAYRAAALLKETFSISQGIGIHLIKRIPIAAGLAGGSTDAAAVLLGLNKLWELGLSQEKLAVFGAALGSDVPFCLYLGTMQATGRGELLSELPDMPSCFIVLAKPNISVSTAWVYQNYRPVPTHPNIDSISTALYNKNIADIAANMANVLESVTVGAYPLIDEIKQFMLEHGAMASLMSGSGPTVFGLVADQQQAIYLAEKLQQIQSVQVFITKPVQRYGGI